MVYQVAKLDVQRWLDGIVPAWAASLICVVMGVGLAATLRALTDLALPGAAPFAFVYPAALLATLAGGWIAGAGTLALSQILAWQFVLPKSITLAGHPDQKIAASAVVAMTCLAVVAVGEGYRRAARNALDERDAKLKERELLYRELQHRVGNDFAIVGSLLDLQRRRSNDPEARGALEQAMSRVRSIGRIHRHLYAAPGVEQVQLAHYLTELCDGLRDAVLPPAGLTLTCDCAPVLMARDRALPVGLVVNELVTNAVKHAFPEGRDGTIMVRFAAEGEGWRLSVSDDGVGLTATGGTGGLGRGLIESFVTQAGGSLSVSGGSGTTVHLELPPHAAVPAAGLAIG
jgi:two-component sensor histidine kinase